MDIFDDIFAIILIMLFGIILFLLPAYIVFPLGFIVAVSGPLALAWRYKKLRDKYKTEKYNMRMILIPDEDYEFLKDLQHELNTQESDGQADPIYWSVMDHRLQPMPEGCGDPIIYMGDGDTMTTEEAVQYVDENIRDYREELQEQWKYVDKNWMADVVTFIHDEMEISECRVVWQEEKEYISHETGAFITKRACKEYIKRFGYNHNKPHTYAMTAYRNFEFGHLLKILKTMEMK